jgi:hypothetical protein
MADFGAPVADKVNVDPLQTIGSLLSLKSKNLAIQGQQQALQGQAADVAMKQRTNSQQQALSQIPWQSFENSDGSYDMDKATKAALAVAPTEGPDFVSRLGAMTKGSADSKAAFSSLNQTYQNNIRSALGAWGANPNASSSDLTTQANIAKANAPDSSKDAVAQVVDHAIQGVTGPDLITGKPKSLEQQKLAAVAFSRAGLSQDAVSGPGGLATPEGGTANTGARIIPTVTNRMSGVTQAANAPPIANAELGPAQQPGYLQTAAAAGASGGAGATNDETAYSQIQQAGSKSKQIASLADDVANLSKSVQTGPLSSGAASKWATTLQSLGISNVGADTWEAKRQLLGKMAAQLRIQANIANGANTDAARADVESAYPNPDTMSPGAVQEAAHYVKGLAAVNQARLNNADKFKATNSGSSLGLRAVDNQFTQNADPKAFVYESLPPGPERQAFLKSHFSTPQEIQQFLAGRAILKHQGALGGQ